MKKAGALIIAVILVSGIPSAFAQSATRALGMAYALTAAADGVDAITYNPAGLGFQKNFTLTVGATAGVSSNSLLSLSDLAQRAQDGYLTAIPQVAFAARNFGASTVFEMSMAPYSMSRSLGAKAGFGLAFGPLAVGANLRWYKYGSFATDSWPVDSASEIPGTLMDLAFEDADGGTAFWGAGLGALLKLGEFAVGAYLPNVTSFLTGDDSSSALGTARTGVSWYPLHLRSGNGTELFSLLVAADVWNLGLESSRCLYVGTECHVNLVVLGAAARAGIAMPLGSGSGAMPVYLGATAHVLFANLDLGLVTSDDALSTLLSGGGLQSLKANRVYATVRATF